MPFANEVLVDGRTFYIDRMSEQQLADLEEVVAAGLISIKEQLVRAEAEVHTDHTYADPDWYARAQTARRIKARQLEAIKRERGKKKFRDRKSIV